MRTLTFTGITAALLTLCVTQGVFAQDAGSGALAGTGSTLTESGSTVRTTKDVTDAVRLLIPGRDPRKLKDVLVAEQKRKAWENESAAARARLAQHRRDCREAVRRANRDQLMDRLLGCYRSDLLQDVNILRKQAQHVGAIPLLDPAVKAAATGAIFHLIDAEMTIVDAIDTGLFEREESLQQARRNLRTTYREPYWIALTRLRADWELTYIVFMVKNIEERLVDPALKGARAQQLHEAALCLETGTLALWQTLTATDRIAAGTALLAARDHLEKCRATLKSVERKEQQELAEKTEEN